MAGVRQPRRGDLVYTRGQSLVAAGEKSDTISVYAIDQATGALKLLQTYPVEIVSFD